MNNTKTKIMRMESIFLGIIVSAGLSIGCSEVHEQSEVEPKASVDEELSSSSTRASGSESDFDPSGSFGADDTAETEHESVDENDGLPDGELFPEDEGANDDYLSSSCHLPPKSGSEEEHRHRGFFRDGWIYKTWGPEVKYCIEPGLLENRGYLEFMKHVLNSTWGGLSGVRYKFNGYCADLSLLDRKKNARVSLHKMCDPDEDGHRAPACVLRGIGTQSRGVEEGVRLPVDIHNKSEKWDYKTWSRYVVHEFGHVHGFAHEQNRPDFKSIEGCKEQGSDGDVVFGVPGAASSMLYFGCGDRYRLPSPTDARMARELFGAQSARFVDTFKFNNWLSTNSDKGPRSGVLVSTMAGNMAAIYDDEVYIYDATPENHGTHRKISYRKIWSVKDTSYLVAGAGSDEIYRVSKDGHIHRWQGRKGNWMGWKQLSKGTLPASMEYVVSNRDTVYAHASGRFVVRYNARTDDWDTVITINDPTPLRVARRIIPSKEDGFYLLHQDHTARVYLIDKYTNRGGSYDIQRIATPKNSVTHIGSDQMGALYWAEISPDNTTHHTVYRYGFNVLSRTHGVIRLADKNLLIRDFFPGYDTLYISNHRDFEKDDPDRGDWGYLYEWVQAAYPNAELDQHPQVNPHTKSRIRHKWVPYIHLAPKVQGRALLHMQGIDLDRRYAVFVSNDNGFWTVGVNTASISF